MSETFYTQSPGSHTHRGPTGTSGATHYPYSTLCAHDAEVMRARAISPDVVMMQGDRSINPQEAKRYGFPALAGLLIARTNAYGIVTGHQLRPHNPPEGTGKYLWPSGFEMGTHIPLTHTKYVHDLNVPVLLTESILKANAIASAETDTPVLPVGISGVWGWRGGGDSIRDLRDDIPLARTKRGRVQQSRKLILVPDSDVRDNPKVTAARYRQTGVHQQQGADVYWIDLPHAADGSKQGVDDVRAAGVSLTEILSWAYRAPRCLPTLADVPTARDEAPEVERLRTEVARLRQENARLLRDNGELVRLNVNRHAKPQAKAAAVRLATLAMSKASRNKDVDQDGRVRVSAGEISEDFRCRPEKGQSQEPTNPDGTVPLMTRGTVRGLLEELRDTHHVLDFESVKVRKKRAANGLPYEDTEFVITAPASLAEVLHPVAWLAPAEPKVRPYRHQEPCIHCHEVHPRTLVCDGCGAAVKHYPLPTEPDPDTYDAGEPLITEFGPPEEQSPIAQNFDAMATAPINSSVQKIYAMDDGPPDDPGGGISQQAEFLDQRPTNTRGHDRWTQ